MHYAVYTQDCVQCVQYDPRYHVMVACFSQLGHYVAPSWQLQLDILARYTNYEGDPSLKGWGSLQQSTLCLKVAENFN